MSYKITIEEINTAFTPSHEIIDPNRFFGRYNEIKQSLISLSTPGSLIAIYGLRGLGKSSLGQQIKKIAEGDQILAKRLGLKRYLPKSKFNYIVKLIQCDDFCTDIFQVIKRIFFGDDKNSSLFAHTALEGRTLEKTKEKVNSSINAGIKLYVAQAGIKDSSESETSYKMHESDDVIQIFKQMLGTVKNDNQKCTGILIVLDEFDVIKDKSGFASIIKTCSSEFVKFAIIGIAEDIPELLEGHASVGRQIDKIELKIMPPEDLIGIINNAEELLNGEMKFNHDVKIRMSEDAEGFAYFVHLFGKESLLLAFERNLKIVDMFIYKKIYSDFVSGRLGIFYETIYEKAVRTTPEAETLLKLFAEEKEHHILTESVYKMAREFGLKEPHQFMQSLTHVGPNKKPILSKIQNRYYRFSDPIFKVYAKKRDLYHVR